jgi:hypothetical protein
MVSRKKQQMTTDMTNENGRWYSSRRECLRASYACTTQLKPNLFNGNGYVWSPSTIKPTSQQLMNLIITVEITYDLCKWCKR